MRVGALGTAVNSRLESGATFYGVMNANDNVAERYVNVSKPEGRAFTGLHGDGKLDRTGLANVQGWPKSDSKGTGYRGFYNNNVVTVSNRQYMDIENAARNAWDGFRGGRTSWGAAGLPCQSISIASSIDSEGWTTLTAGNGISYKWNTGQQNNRIMVRPEVATTYIVTARTAGGCTRTASITVPAYVPPIPEEENSEEPIEPGEPIEE